MKEIVIATAAGALLCLFATFLFRLLMVERRARMLLSVYLICLCVLVVIYLLTPDDLGVLPATMVSPSRAAGLLFCAFLYSAGFFGGVLQVYNLADRGLSLRMLADIALVAGGCMTPADMIEHYAAGKGLGWMYDKRLDGMLATGLIEHVGADIHLTPKGERLAMRFAALKAFARS